MQLEIVKTCLKTPESKISYSIVTGHAEGE